jgi:hypothetical protein
LALAWAVLGITGVAAVTPIWLRAVGVIVSLVGLSCAIASS